MSSRIYSKTEPIEETTKWQRITQSKKPSPQIDPSTIKFKNLKWHRISPTSFDAPSILRRSSWRKKNLSEKSFQKVKDTTRILGKERPTPSWKIPQLPPPLVAEGSSNERISINKAEADRWRANIRGIACIKILVRKARASVARVAASPNILLIGRSLVTKPREERIREGEREGGRETYVKRGGTATPWSNLDVSSVGRRSFVSQRQPCASSFFSFPPLPLAFLRLSVPPSPRLFPSRASNFLHPHPRLTRGALPTCQRYIFCRPTNRLAGNFEIGTLI